MSPPITIVQNEMVRFDKVLNYAANEVPGLKRLLVDTKKALGPFVEEGTFMPPVLEFIPKGR